MSEWDEKKFFEKACALRKELSDSDSELKDIVDYTKNIISSSSDKILNGEFDINPKVYDRDNVSCKFCKYKDLCFMKEKDLVYLEKVDNLDFLGGEE